MFFVRELAERTSDNLAATAQNLRKLAKLIPMPIQTPRNRCAGDRAHHDPAVTTARNTLLCSPTSSTESTVNDHPRSKGDTTLCAMNG
jgi:hypothetical protein